MMDEILTSDGNILEMKQTDMLSKYIANITIVRLLNIPTYHGRQHKFIIQAF